MRVLHYLSYRSDGAFVLIGELHTPRLLVFVCKQPTIRIQSLQPYAESCVRNPLSVYYTYRNEKRIYNMVPFNENLLFFKKNMLCIKKKMLIFLENYCV
jgi:hypothetical protein